MSAKTEKKSHKSNFSCSVDCRLLHFLYIKRIEARNKTFTRRKKKPFLMEKKHLATFCVQFRFCPYICTLDKAMRKILAIVHICSSNVVPGLYILSSKKRKKSVLGSHTTLLPQRSKSMYLNCFFNELACTKNKKLILDFEV